jgi:hypothetical protein
MSPFEKGGTMASERQKMLSTYTRPISFTTEVVVNVLYVERRKAGVRSHPPKAAKT